MKVVVLSLVVPVVLAVVLAVVAVIMVTDAPNQHVKLTSAHGWVPQAAGVPSSPFAAAEIQRRTFSPTSISNPLQVMSGFGVATTMALQPPTPHQRAVAPQLPSPVFMPPNQVGKNRCTKKGGAGRNNERGGIGCRSTDGTAGGAPKALVNNIDTRVLQSNEGAQQTLKRKRGRPALPGRVMEGVSLATEVRLTSEVGDPMYFRAR